MSDEREEGGGRGILKEVELQDYKCEEKSLDISGLEWKIFNLFSRRRK